MAENAPPNQETNVIETLQSLIIAFVLAMTFRGFVTEGFVIPTGSMAPTLLGQHTLIHSHQTGLTFPVGLEPNADPRRIDTNRIADPMLGEKYPGSGFPGYKRQIGMGDRILVLKSLYPFAEPKRFDVVVFKNPTDPNGEAANYIKRLIGLPNEQVWLADGDVFAKHDGESEFRIQRKPEHVQRAVWQMVYNSDFIPTQPTRLLQRYEGPPWVGDPAMWKIDGRAYRSLNDHPATLTWDLVRRGLNDWAPYNMLASRTPRPVPVSDLRISAGLVASQRGLKTTLELEARSHIFQFTIDDGGAGGQSTATLRMRSIAADSGESKWIERTAPISLPAPGKVFDVEFWHADQALRLFINGKRVMDPLEYDWTPVQRLQFATGDLTQTNVEALLSRESMSPQVRWKFEGSPVTLYRLRVDRDLFYRHDILAPNSEQRNQPYIYGHMFGTDPQEQMKTSTGETLINGKLGPDQFMMCGDNSQMSLDSRLWGRPHPLVASQIDPHPFTVHRDLLLGKAWVVYFPAPFPLYDGGAAIVPDFGRLRFIR